MSAESIQPRNGEHEKPNNGALEFRWNWQKHALGTKYDPEIFFPEKGGSGAKAQAICARCPVLRECLTAALVRGEEYGVIGGLAERERGYLRKSLRLESNKDASEGEREDYLRVFSSPLLDETIALFLQGQEKKQKGKNTQIKPIDIYTLNRQIVEAVLIKKVPVKDIASRFRMPETDVKKIVYEGGQKLNAQIRARNKLKDKKPIILARSEEIAVRREKVLTLNRQGRKCIEIAEELDLKPGTVDDDLRNLRRQGFNIKKSRRSAKEISAQREAVAKHEVES